MGGFHQFSTHTSSYVIHDLYTHGSVATLGNQACWKLELWSGHASQLVVVEARNSAPEPHIVVEWKRTGCLYISVEICATQPRRYVYATCAYHRWWFQTTWTFFQGESTSIYPCWTFPNGPKGLGGVAGGGNESQGELITKTLGSWNGEVGGFSFTKMMEWLRCFFLLGHNGCDECFSPCNLFGIFSGDISWGMFWKSWALGAQAGSHRSPMQVEVPKPPKCLSWRWDSVESVLRVAMFCSFFLGGWGWGDIFFSCLKTGEKSLFCLVGSF